MWCACNWYDNGLGQLDLCNRKILDITRLESPVSRHVRSYQEGLRRWMVQGDNYRGR